MDGRGCFGPLEAAAASAERARREEEEEEEGGGWGTNDFESQGKGRGEVGVALNNSKSSAARHLGSMLRRSMFVWRK